jgi:hypothetical protein
MFLSLSALCRPEKGIVKRKTGREGGSEEEIDKLMNERMKVKADKISPRI